MSLSVMSLALCQQKGRDRGRWVGAPEGLAASMLGCRKALVGTGWVISLLFCMNRLRNLPSVLVGPPFLRRTLFSQSAQAVIGGEP